MNAAILAAGEGSRLRAEGIQHSKPLIPVCGIPMIDRLIHLAVESQVESISVIVNEEQRDVRAYCSALSLPIPCNLVVRSTASSMHSLFALAPFLHTSPFYCTTVDTIFLESEFHSFMAYAHGLPHTDGVLAITEYIDDERPLCVALDDERRITAFSDTQEGYRWATGGLYYFSPRIFTLIPEALDAGTTRLRNFLRMLIARRYTLHGFVFSTMIDVDHAADIAAAEAFLTQHHEHA